jgi:DNA-binding transcriptional LysR family regulator
MQLGWLHTFVTVYRLGSFTKASHALGLSQPAVTQQIRNLERALGKPLFERLPHGASPTPAAESLVREVQGPLDVLTAAVDRHFGPPTEQRPLHLGGPAELITARVLPAVSDLIRDGLRLRVTFGLADDLLTALADGRLDLVLSTIRPRLRGLTATALGDEEFALLASPEIAGELSGRLSGEPPAEHGPAALDAYPLIAYAESLPIIRRYWLTVFGVRPTAPPAVVVPDLRGALAAVKASAGISVLPTYLCAGELARGEVVPLLTPEVPPLNTFYLVTRAGTLTQPHLARLHDHLLRAARAWR